MRILLAPMTSFSSALGPLTRCLAAADEARRRGWDILFYANGPFVGLVESAGYRLVRGPLPTFFGKPRWLSSIMFRVWTLMGNPIRPCMGAEDIIGIMGYANERYIERELDSILRVIDGFKPDVIFSEFQPVVPVAARVARIPLATTASWPSSPEFRSALSARPPEISKGSRPFARVMMRRGIEPIRSVRELSFAMSDMKIVPSIPELEPLPGTDDFCYTGPLLWSGIEEGDFPVDLLPDDRPLIYCYFSTGFISPKKFRAVLPAAFSDGRYAVVVGAGRHVALRGELPLRYGDVVVSELLPGTRVISMASAVIFHGGQNTMMSVLMGGRPSLVFAGRHFERDFNATRLESIGAGMRCGVEQFNPRELRELVDEIVGNPSFAERARLFGEKLKSTGGARAALDFIEGKLK